MELHGFQHIFVVWNVDDPTVYSILVNASCNRMLSIFMCVLYLFGLIVTHQMACLVVTKHRNLKINTRSNLANYLFWSWCLLWLGCEEKKTNSKLNHILHEIKQHQQTTQNTFKNIFNETKKKQQTTWWDSRDSL